MSLETSTVLLIHYIESKYGYEKGNKKSFLADNTHITGPELSRWLKNDYRVVLDTGDIFRESNKKVNIKR